MKLTRSLTQSFLAALLLTGCAGPRSANESASHGDAEFTRLARLARAAYDQGSLAQAETLYRQAHRRAREIDAPADLGDAAYNLAAVLVAFDRSLEAWPLLEEAEVELKRAGQTPADVWLVKARLAIAEKRTAEALRWIEAAETTDTLAPAQRAAATVLRGALACDERNLPQARQQLEVAREQLTDGNMMVAASIEKLSGRVALLEGQAAEAAAAFDREAAFCRRAAQHRAMAQALVRAGQAFAQAGDARAGAERLYRAARSYFGQGHLSAAQKLIAQGEELAKTSGDESLRRRLHHLAAEADPAPH